MIDPNAPVQSIPTPAPEAVIPVTPEAVPQAVPDVTPAPAVEAPLAPVAVEPAAVPTPTPEVTPEPAVKAPEVTPAPEKKPETFLADKPVEAKPPEAVVEVKDEGGQTEEPAPPPTYEPFKTPDDVPLDAERVGKFTELLSKLEVGGKADHAAVQAFGQEAVDFHIAEVTKAVTDYHEKAVASWEKQRNDWKELVIKDPEMGGNRLETTLDAARSFIRLYGGSTEQQDEIRNVMETSGLGNHPAIIRLFSAATRELAEAKPLAGGRPVPATKSKTQTLYGKG
jgi:hypothetical protein